MYADDNHKPEMAVTLSDFEALCGFRPFPEIIWNLRFYPELRALVSHDAIFQVRESVDEHARANVDLCHSGRGFVTGRPPPPIEYGNRDNGTYTFRKG